MFDIEKLHKNILELSTQKIADKLLMTEVTKIRVINRIDESTPTVPAPSKIETYSGIKIVENNLLPHNQIVAVDINGNVIEVIKLEGLGS